MDKKVSMGICPGCKKEVEKTEQNKIKGKNNYTRYWHPTCWQAAQKEKEKKIAEEMGRKAIFNYLIEIGMAPNYSFWGRQRNDFINKYNYNDSGILMALKYWFGEKNNTIERANGGMGIVPYIYDEAQRYYRNIILKKHKLAEQAIRQQSEENKTVMIKTVKENDKKGFIDLNSLIGDE